MKRSAILAVVLPFAVAFGLGASVVVSHILGYGGWFSLGAPSAPAAPVSSLDRLEQDMNLRGGQKEDFGRFRKFCNGDICSCKDRISKARAELGRAILAESSDPDRIERARRDLTEVYEESQKVMIDQFLTLKKGLDPEQKRKMAEAFFPGTSQGDCSCGRDCEGGNCRGLSGNKGE
jgi:hypothetical protein